MCFTPLISLSTAIIEFILATILLLFFKKTIFRNFFIILIYLLGFYQLTEFMLCKGGNTIFWAIIGFLTYNFLPAIGLHAVLKFLNKKFNILLLYFIPILVSFLVIIFPVFVDARCSKFFVNVKTIFHNALFLNSIPFYFYIFYYAGFIIFACYLLYKDYTRQRNKIRKELDVIEISGILLMTIPTFVLILLVPFLGIEFPSVLCRFAIFVAIAAFLGATLEGKIRKG